MPHLIIPRPVLWKPPVGAVIDWAHPLARGLAFCELFNEGGSVNQTAPAREIAYGMKGAIGGNTGATYPTWNQPAASNVPHDGVSFMTYYGLGGNFSYEDRPQFHTAGGLTVEAGIRANAYQYLGGGAINVKDGAWRLQANYSGNVCSFWIGTWSGPVAATEAVGWADDVTFADIAGVYSVDPLKTSIYHDGRLAGACSGTPEAAVPDNANPVAIGMNIAGGAPFNGVVAWSRVWTRALSADELKWLAAEPFAMFRGPEVARRFWTVAGAGITSHRRRMAQVI